MNKAHGLSPQQVIKEKQIIRYENKQKLAKKKKSHEMESYSARRCCITGGEKRAEYMTEDACAKRLALAAQSMLLLVIKSSINKLWQGEAV